MSNRQKLGRFKKNKHLKKDAKAPSVQKQIPPRGFARKVELPDDEKELLKEVPAKVDGTVVGTALLYDDGSVDIMIDEDADPALVEKIKATESEFGFSTGTVD